MPIYADGGRIEQVLVNLIVNGMDACTQHGAESPHVVVRVRAVGELAVAEVSDNGGGLPAEARRHLFEAFYTTKGTGGTGLGLYLSKSLAQAQGGDLELDSTGPSGTTFTVTLPLTRERAERRSSAPAHPISVGEELAPGDHPPRILVVDDERSLVRALTRWLRRWAEVTGTTDPFEGVELAAEGDFTLILCDLNMPRMLGTDFLTALSDRNPEAASRVVIMTGSGGVDIPGVRVVSKPLQPQVIEELLFYGDTA